MPNHEDDRNATGVSTAMTFDAQAAQAADMVSRRSSIYTSSFLCAPA
jgi:hypothetical protein